MVGGRVIGQDGVMNDTEHDQGPDLDQSEAVQPPPEGFDPRRLRTVFGVKRSRDDRMVAGVCSGVARYLNIDPVVLRILVAAFTVVGGAGLIMYLAAWFLLPSEDAEKSVAADWFNLDENEESVRIVGFVVAAVIAVTAGTGMVGGAWDTPFPWFALVALGALYIFVIRPGQKRRTGDQVAHTFEPGSTIAQPVTKPREPWSPTLTLVTIFTSVVAAGGMALYSSQNPEASITFAAYVMAVLTVVGLGLVVGAWFGNGGALIGIGAVLAIALAISSALPGAGIGQRTYRPVDSQSVSADYRLGVGQLTVDLTDVADLARLANERIDVTNSVGRTEVVVPDGLNVEVVASITGGEIRLFDRKENGDDIMMRYPAEDPTAPTTKIVVHNTFGDIEVIKQ